MQTGALQGAVLRLGTSSTNAAALRVTGCLMLLLMACMCACCYCWRGLCLPRLTVWHSWLTQRPQPAAMQCTPIVQLAVVQVLAQSPRMPSKTGMRLTWSLARGTVPSCTALSRGHPLLSLLQQLLPCSCLTIPSTHSHVLLQCVKHSCVDSLMGHASAGRCVFCFLTRHDSCS